MFMDVFLRSTIQHGMAEHRSQRHASLERCPSLRLAPQFHIQRIPSVTPRLSYNKVGWQTLPHVTFVWKAACTCKSIACPTLLKTSYILHSYNMNSCACSNIHHTGQILYSSLDCRKLHTDNFHITRINTVILGAVQLVNSAQDELAFSYVRVRIEGNYIYSMLGVWVSEGSVGHQSKLAQELHA